MQIGSVLFRFEFNPHDTYIGVYWRKYWEMEHRVHNYWIVLIPMVPLFVSVIGRKATELDKW